MSVPLGIRLQHPHLGTYDGRVIIDLFLDHLFNLRVGLLRFFFSLSFFSFFFAAWYFSYPFRYNFIGYIRIYTASETYLFPDWVSLQLDRALWTVVRMLLNCFISHFLQGADGNNKLLLDRTSMTNQIYYRRI